MFQRKNRGRKEMEGLLRAGRPEPSPELADDLVRRIHTDSAVATTRRPRRRLAVAAVATGSLVVAGVAAGLLSDGRDAATGSVASAGTALRSATAPTTKPDAAYTAAKAPAASSATADQSVTAPSKESVSASAPVGTQASGSKAPSPSQGTGLKDLSRYLAQLTLEPENWTGTFPVYLCHADIAGGYSNGGTGRLSAANESEYDTLRLAHQNHPYDEGFYQSQPNCTQL